MPTDVLNIYITREKLKEKEWSQVILNLHKKTVIISLKYVLSLKIQLSIVFIFVL